jgi:hypothetical protein
VPPELFNDQRPGELDGQALLEYCWARLERLEQRQETFVLNPSGLLAGDNAQNTYDPISFQVGWLFLAAFDNLNVLRRSLADHGMPVVAAYPLIRAALEAACQALYLLSPGKRRPRVVRSIKRVWRAWVISEPGFKSMFPDEPSNMDRVRERLEELLEASGNRSVDLNRDSTTMSDIVSESRRHVRVHRLDPFDVWRLCSSASHANSRVLLSLIEHHPMGDADEVGQTYLASSSRRVVGAFVRVTLSTIECALDRRDQLNVPQR